MSPEKIIHAGTDGGERSQGSVPVERWGNYARELIPGLTLYDTYQNLPLHVEEVKKTVAFARENISGNPDRILILGSGQNTIEISAIYKVFKEPEIIASDIQPKFLETLMKRLARHDKKAFDKTYPLQMDIGRPWPKKVSNGDGKVIDLESVPLVFCNIVFNWLTEEEQKEV